MDCAFCRKAIKKDVVKCIPCCKVFHPGCIGLHKVVDGTGRLVLCTGESTRFPSTPEADIFVDAPSIASAALSLSTAATTTTITTTTTMTSSSDVSYVSAAAPRPSYRTGMSTAPTVSAPAPTTELSQLCADVRAVLKSQGDLKSMLQAHTVKLNQCMEFNKTQRAHNESVGKALASLTAEINGKFEALTQSYAEVSSRVGELETSLSSLKAQLNSLKSAPVATPSVLSSADAAKAMSMRIRKLEQDQLTCDLLISGLPENRNEKLSLLVVRIAEVLEVPLSVRDIVNVRRLPSSLPRTQGPDQLRGKPRATLVRLCSSSVKENLIAARRRKGRLLANEINNEFSENLVRLNDFLPKDTWLLLRSVRAAARERGYKFSWFSRGNILVKKDSDSTPIRISSERDIDAKIT